MEKNNVSVLVFGCPRNRKILDEKLDNNQIFIGGEYAAELVTEYLKAVQFTLYTDMPKIDTMRALKLIPDNDGSLVIYKKFWKNQFFNIKNLNLAPLLLIYADLMITNDPRCKETALKIYNKYLIFSSKINSNSNCCGCRNPKSYV